MILEVPADTAQRVVYRDAGAAQMIGVADTGKLQDVGGADGTGGQNDLARGIRLFRDPAARERDTGRARSIEQHAMHQRVRHDLQIGPFHRGPQIRSRGAGPKAPAACLLHPADMVAKPRRKIVHILPVGPSHLRARLHRRLTQHRLVARAGGEQRAALGMNGGGRPFPVLGLAEVGKDIVPGPAAITQLRPVVVILGLAANIDHAVDRTGPAQDPAARIGDFPPVKPGIGVRLVAPGQRGVVEQLHVTSRDVDHRMPVAAPGLDQHDARVRVLGQAVGHDTAGRPRAHDDIIGLH